MKNKLVGTAITSLALIAVLLLSVGRTPVLALPAADNLAPGETISYSLSTYSSVDSLFESDAYDNTTKINKYIKDFSTKQTYAGLEIGTIDVGAISTLGNGMYVAAATSSGNLTGYSNTNSLYYEFNNFTGTVVANDSYTNHTQYPTYLFSGVDSTFIFNNTFVPYPDMIIGLLFNASFDPSVYQNQSTPLSLDILNGDEFNIPFVADFFANFTPSFTNSSSVKSETRIINGYSFNVNVLSLLYESHINEAFNGTVVDAFTLENYTNPINWSVYATITFDMNVQLVYDKDTGLLLEGSLDGGMTITIYANALIPNYDPDGAGPIQPVDLLPVIFTRTSFFIDNSLIIDGVSYLYTSPTTTSNTTSSVSNTTQTTNNTNTGTNNTTNTPFAGLPAPGFEVAITSLITTIAVISIIRKKR